MSKQDYVKNSSIDGVADDALECFYDNIVYTPFIRVEEEDEAKIMQSRRSKRPLRSIKHVVPEPVRPKTSKEPLDPYTLIFESKLDVLRPPLREVMNLEDPYSYIGPTASLDPSVLKSSKVGILQIESSRSRPDAFMSPSGIQNPEDAKIGIVELPVDKVGVLWRKDPKKKTARSPWQEWGAILCGAGLYFFKNSSWVKSLMHQCDAHIRNGHQGTPCTFSPAIMQFKPEYMLPTDHGVALHDGTYKRHKHAFVFLRPSGSEEVFLADNEAEKNDWLAKLNQQAAFKTAGIRQRGLMGGHYDGQRQRGMRRLESSTSTSTVQTVQTATGDVTIQSGKIDHHLAQQISVARQDAMKTKISEAEEKLVVVIKQIDTLLRDARHILILAPIQSKSREHLVHAASRTAAKLKWIRIEMWRMKCHRDILALDLEEEKKEHQKRQLRLDKSTAKATSIASQSSASTARPKTNGVERLNSAASNLPLSIKAQHSPTTSMRPDIVRSPDVSRGVDIEEDVFKTPPEHSPMSTPRRRSSTDPFVTKPTPGTRASQVSAIKSPMLLPPDDNGSPSSPTYSEYKTPILDDEEAERQREAIGLLSPRETFDGASPMAKTDTHTDSDIDPEKTLLLTGSPESRAKGRRSLQRTLRDSGSQRDSVSSHQSNHRSRRSKNDSISSAVPEESSPKAGEDRLDSEVMLKREKGSFTVHGKKASVVTFGAEWAKVAPEERLKLRKQSQVGHISLPEDGNKPTDKDSVVVDDDTDSSAPGFSRSKSHQPRASQFLSSLEPDSRSRSSSMSSSTAAAMSPGQRKHSSSFSHARDSPVLGALKLPARRSSVSLRERRAARKGSLPDIISPKNLGLNQSPDEPQTAVNIGDHATDSSKKQHNDAPKQQAIHA